MRERHRDELVKLRPGRDLNLENTGAEILHDHGAFHDRIFFRKLVSRANHLRTQHLRECIRQLGHLRQGRRRNQPAGIFLLRFGDQRSEEE